MYRRNALAKAKILGGTSTTPILDIVVVHPVLKHYGKARFEHVAVYPTLRSAAAYSIADNADGAAQGVAQHAAEVIGNGGQLKDVLRRWRKFISQS